MSSMTFRAIDGTGDWTFGRGRQSYFTDSQAISANIRTRLLVYLGECFFALKDGVDWRNLIGGKNPLAMANIVAQCRTIIATSYGVAKINSVTADFFPGTRRLNVTYDIDTIFTRGVVQTAIPIET